MDSPLGRPEQMKSQVDYDPNLTDPFFETDEHFEGHPLQAGSEPVRVKHTAKCFSDSFQRGQGL